MTKGNLLRRASSRASQDPFFLAGVLDAFCSRRNMHESELASFLLCQSKDIPRIGLCRRPDPYSATFRSDIDRVAESFDLCADRLVQVIRESDVLDTINTISPTAEERKTDGLLIAARDRESDNPDTSTTPPDDSNTDEEDS